MIDSHAHLSAEQFDSDRTEVIARSRDAGVSWIEIGTTLEDSRKALEFPHASVGVHPNDIEGLTDADWDELGALASHEHCHAIGEVGLDFSREGKLEDQEAVLKRFIALAQQKNLPMIFHVRSAATGVEEADAHQELIRILRDYSNTNRPRGVIHTFSGSLAQAQEYIALGMMISFSGVITFKNAGELPEIAKTIPLENILVETDCPFLTPEPFRGKRNEPMYVKYAIQKIADLRGVSFREIEQATEHAAKRLFGI
ncbi:MAG: hypothetical protein A3C02_00180 [Candidatus Andersenbacteria bacterium RIFCSPHIGHO2_02_FULL_45_11]|uniref:Hydrolase TatD n=1 Tax=Candidatus Andersenbacteria bacterium RIFCSPHIGHO2_12_FULL_45_11 TaxID=1797281 RepID=A0A1G1X1H7_9BACT|nr:MAG: hypothetical protein A2805_00980 [Candidatus Andersenbacteria bacterium RIFCSPHIGHO2_01_FULL_46_36]OGY33651.1 MAG: hypothetical protein A3D99_03840 [Candidatus Andersenbacteria bacterium RIFCSPHIGHO2_12_FULL_45_11]OGY34816.1 MAG: hypothetical protein A3C02_00180 [Candidatus Andersenbacteria bacterium RIFCSPHIGHO2_02_FULL_45_11]